MNLADHIRNVNLLAYKKRDDPELESALHIIVDKFSSDTFSNKSIEFDIYFKDSFGKYDNRSWDNSELSEKQQLFLYKQAAKDLEPLCDKLRLFGFKCKVVAKVSKVYGKQILHTPWIEVKV